MHGTSRIGSIVAGIGGLGLLCSLFLPWASAGGDEQTGFEFLASVDVLLVSAALIAVAAALTGGRIGFFRRDVSLIGAADMFGVVSSLVVGWLLLFDMPAGAESEAGAFLALAATVAIWAGAGDYSVFRGQPAFPRLGEPGDRGDSNPVS